MTTWEMLRTASIVFALCAVIMFIRFLFNHDFTWFFPIGVSVYFAIKFHNDAQELNANGHDNG